MFEDNQLERMGHMRWRIYCLFSYMYPKRGYCLGVKMFNVLPSYIKIESDIYKKFKLILQKFLYENSFCSFHEYFELQKS